MIEGLQPYSEYKESGLPWLRSIPKHWQTARNGNLFQQRNDTRHPDLPVLEVSLRTGVRVREFDSSKRKQVMADACKYKRAAAGDIAYNMMRMWQGAVGVAPVDGLVSPAYVVARPFPGTQARYFTSLFKNGVYMGEIDAASRGIVKDRNRLYWDQFKQMRSLLPSPHEQAAIVRFLEHANRKIDGFIRAKRKLIGLLNEQKQAIIHRAVTRGIDLHASLKPSGIPWLGDIPKHWEVLALKRILCRLIDCEHKTAPAAEGSDLRVVRTTGIRHGRLQFHGTYGTTPQAFTQWTRRGLPEAGDVLFTREAPAGEACVMPSGITLCMGQRTVLMKLRANRINAQFLVHSIYGGPPRTAITLASQGSTVGHFNMSDIGSLTVFLPPLPEQATIVESIERDTEPLNTAIARTEREIALMQEYRTRLTADVVTGKLDVREAAAKLPEVAVPDLTEGSLDDETNVDEDPTQED